MASLRNQMHHMTSVSSKCSPGTSAVFDTERENLDSLIEVVEYNEYSNRFDGRQYHNGKSHAAQWLR